MRLTINSDTPRDDWKELGREPMSRQQQKFSAEYVRSILDYNPETGVLTWKENMSTTARTGQQAGMVGSRGYRRIGIRGALYAAHRLAWVHFHGVWPKEEIDHINCVKDDNRICNLREATCAQNKKNTLHPNKSGLAGASWHEGLGKYRVQIRVEGKRKFLGWFATAEEAHEVYVEASRKYHGEWSVC